MPENQELMQEINTRLTTIGESVSEERLKKLVNDQLELLLGDEKFSRKMRFGAAEPRLIGSKYARWNLDVADIEWLYDLQSALAGSQKKGGGVHAGPSEMLRKAWGDISTAMYVPESEVRAMDMKAIDDEFPRIPLMWLRGHDRELMRQGRWQETKAYANIRGTVEMDTAQSGFGSQLTGAQYVADLWTAARAESRVFSLIDTFEMTAPTAYLPVEVDIPEMLYVGEPVTDLPYTTNQYALSKTGSNRVQVNAKKFIINQLWSGEMEEDSIIPFIPFLRRQATLSLAYYSDSLVLNGDTQTAATGNVNLVDSTPAATKHYLAFDAIRRSCITDATTQKADAGGAITLALLNNIPSRLLDSANQVNVDWGHPTNASDLVHICDPQTGDKIGLLAEILLWRQYAGSPLLLNGTTPLLNGQVGDIIGRPIITSMAVKRTDATGNVSNTGGNNTKGQVVTFNRRGCKIGWRRRVKMETERIPGADQTRLIYSLRLGFGRFTPTGAASGIRWADVLYNIT